MSYLYVLGTFLVLYLGWAVVLSDSFFHRLWSLSLFSLFGLSFMLCSFPISLYTIPLSLLTLITFLICIALSPLQWLFNSSGSNHSEQTGMTVIFPKSTSLNDDGDSQCPIFAESGLRHLAL
jgi:hypothetical protein